MHTLTKFKDIVPRKDKDYLHQLSESRFDNFNKDPKVNSNVQRVRGFNFSKQTNRSKDLFQLPSQLGIYYNPNKERIMSRLEAGIVDLKKT